MFLIKKTMYNFRVLKIDVGLVQNFSSDIKKLIIQIVFCFSLKINIYIYSRIKQKTFNSYLYM